MFEDEEAEGEVDAILSEITGNKLSSAGYVPSTQPSLQEKAAPVAATEEDEEDEDEELLNSMRERLKALQS
ncbi:hypothetical protein D0Z03_000612 [Geotrichum reessii]|nr:hypothetical protein D0Z03_000612 [Galactomyces reessii]